MEHEDSAGEGPGLVGPLHEAAPDPGSARPSSDPAADAPPPPDPAIVDLIDSDWYLACYPDVSEGGLDAVTHYLNYGAKEGRQPSAFFDPAWYLEKNPDVRASGISPLIHYAKYGWREGRSPGSLFDSTRYLTAHNDVRDAGVEPLTHYLLSGRREERAIFPASGSRGGGQPTVVPKPGPPRVTVLRPADDLDAAMRRFIDHVAPLCEKTGPIAAIYALPVFGRGGSEKVALSFAKVYRRDHRDRSALVLVTDRPGTEAAHAFPDGVYLVSLDAFGPFTSASATEGFLLRILQAIRPAVFHIINSDAAWRLLSQHGTRLQALTRVFGSMFCVQRDYRTRAPLGYAQSYFEVAATYCHHLLTDNDRFARDVTDLFPHRAGKTSLRRIYNPAEWPEARTITGPDAADTRSPASSPSILWAGRLDRQKRVELLFETARLLPEIQFFMYGSAVTDGDVEIQDLPNVTLQGEFASMDDLFASRAYAAYMHTTHEEGMPNILLEMGLKGLPVIAPAIGGIPELIDETTGYLIPAHASAQDYREAIQTILAEPDTAAIRARSLRARVLERHSWPAFEDAVRAIPGYLR